MPVPDVMKRCAEAFSEFADIAAFLEHAQATRDEKVSKQKGEMKRAVGRVCCETEWSTPETQAWWEAIKTSKDEEIMIGAVGVIRKGQFFTGTGLEHFKTHAAKFCAFAIRHEQVLANNYGSPGHNYGSPGAPECETSPLNQQNYGKKSSAKMGFFRNSHSNPGQGRQPR